MSALRHDIFSNIPEDHLSLLNNGEAKAQNVINFLDLLRKMSRVQLASPAVLFAMMQKCLKS